MVGKMKYLNYALVFIALLFITNQIGLYFKPNQELIIKIDNPITEIKNNTNTETDKPKKVKENISDKVKISDEVTEDTFPE